MEIILLVTQRRFSTYVWLLLGYPPLVVIHSLACFLSWILVFTIPVFKMNARTLGVILLLAPEDVSVSTCSERKARKRFNMNHRRHINLEMLFSVGLMDRILYFLLDPQHPVYETRALLCCYHAANWYYYKYTVDGINVFAVSILHLWVREVCQCVK